jgi:hypothetical protein
MQFEAMENNLERLAVESVVERVVERCGAEVVEREEDADRTGEDAESFEVETELLKSFSPQVEVDC